MELDRVAAAAEFETRLFNYIESTANNCVANPLFPALLQYLRESAEFQQWTRSVDNSFAFLPDDIKTDVLRQTECLEEDKRSKELCASYPYKCNLLKHICRINGMWGQLARQVTCSELKGERLYLYSLDKDGINLKKVQPEDMAPTQHISFTALRYPKSSCSEDQLVAVGPKLYGYLDMEFDAPRPKLFQRLFPSMISPFSKIFLRCPGLANAHIDHFIIRQISLKHLRSLQLSINFSADVEPYIVKFVKSENFECFLANARNSSAAFYQALYSVFMEKTSTTTQSPYFQLRIDELTSQQIKKFLYILYAKDAYRNLEEPNYRTSERHAVLRDVEVRTDINKQIGFSELKVWQSKAER